MLNELNFLYKILLSLKYNNYCMFAIFLCSIVELILSIIILAFFLLQNLYNFTFARLSFYLSFCTPVAAWFYQQFSIGLFWISETFMCFTKKKQFKVMVKNLLVPAGFFLCMISILLPLCRFNK